MMRMGSVKRREFYLKYHRYCYYYYYYCYYYYCWTENYRNNCPHRSPSLISTFELIPSLIEELRTTCCCREGKLMRVVTGQLVLEDRL